MAIEMIRDLFLQGFVFVVGLAAHEAWEPNLGKLSLCLSLLGLREAEQPTSLT